MYNKEKLVNLFNDLVYEAIMHGADSGGSYESNDDKLISKLLEIIEVFDLSEYRVGVIWHTKYYDGIGIAPKKINSNGYDYNEIVSGKKAIITVHNYNDKSYVSKNGCKEFNGAIVSSNEDYFEIEWDESVHWTNKTIHKMKFMSYDIFLGNIKINSIS